MTDDNKSGLIISLNIFLITVSTILMSIRLYVRRLITKALGLDDAIATIAYGLCVSLSVLEIDAAFHGSGHQMNSLEPAMIPVFFSKLPTLQLMFFLTTGAVRLSVLAFLPRLNKDKVYMRIIYGFAALVIATTLICFFILLTECEHIPDLWDVTVPDRQCMDKQKEAYMMWTHSIIGIIVDLALLTLPIWLIHKNLRFSTKTIQVILVFCIGIFAVTTGVIRFAIIVTTDFAVNTTFKMVRVATWTNVETHMGLWCGTFPALQPLLRLISYKIGLRSTIKSTREKKAGGGRYYKSGAASGSSVGSNKGTRGQSRLPPHLTNLDSEDAIRDDDSSGKGMVIQVEERNAEMFDLESGGGPGFRSSSSSHDPSSIGVRTDVQVQVSDVQPTGVKGSMKGSTSWIAL